MKKLLFALALLVPSIAVAAPDYVVGNGTSPVNNALPFGGMGSGAVDANGNVYIRTNGTPIPVSGTLSPSATPQPVLLGGTSPTGITVQPVPASNAVGLNGIPSPMIGVIAVTNLTCTAGSTTTCTVTSSSPRVGDYIRGNSGTTANVNAWSIVTGASGTVVTFSPALPAAVVNTDVLTLLRPLPVSLNSNANEIQINAPPSRDSIVQLEDNASATADELVKTGLVTQSAVTGKTSTTGDWGVMVGDMGGRPVITMAPADETWQACGTATASTADTQIKASVASNRIYVTSFTCKNTSATTATSIDFKDGTTTYAVGGVSQMATASSGSFDAYFNPPLRGTSATALNFATNVSVSSVTCCAAGYISTL